MKAKIQQDRLEYAEMRILELGYDIFFKNDSQFHFEYMGNTIRVFPYTGWFTGVGVTDGRGLENLLKQIGANWDSLKNCELDEKLIKW